MKASRILFGLLLAIPSVLLSQTAAPKEPAVGDTAPDFRLPYATKDSVSEEEITLSSFAGKRNVVLAFYPADWSGGCTKEVCTLRDNFTDLATLNAEILGISGDYEYSHHEWAKYHNLPFKLVSDHSHAVAKQYASYNETAGFNRRTVVVVNKSGKIAYVDLHYSVRDLDSFTKLQAALKSLQ
jgi:peroxiredoxin